MKHNLSFALALLAVSAVASAANRTAVPIDPPASESARDSANRIVGNVNAFAQVAAAQMQSSQASFVNATIYNGGSFTIPPGTASVDGYIAFTWTSNNAGVAKFDVKDAAGNVQQTYYAGNYGFNDGGSGSAWWLPVSIKVQADSATITMTQIYGSNSLSWNVKSVTSL